MDAERQKLIDSLLDDRSHHIEFNGHLTNHNKHAVIALEKLGASKERIKAYYDGYARCTPYGYSLEPARRSIYKITHENWKSYLGKRTSYSSYYDFFSAEEKSMGMDPLLEKYVPLLISGWCSALTHPAIHLGWALDSGNRTMIIEGLAYLAFSYISCYPERAFKASGDNPGNASAIASMIEIANQWEQTKPRLQDWSKNLVNIDSYDQDEDINPELIRSGLQYRVARMLETGHGLIYSTPRWLIEEDIDTVWLSIYEAVTLLYFNEPGDFLLLHFITAVHGMHEIAIHMPLVVQYEIAKNAWIGILCTLFSRAYFPSAESLVKNYKKFLGRYDEEKSVGVISFWKLVTANAIEEDEEHNPKMVYALKTMWKLSGYKSLFREATAFFTTTPELPKSFDKTITVG